jgi:hypothetical protein
MEIAATPKLLDQRRFEALFGMRWRTVIGLERDGIIRVVRIGRKCYIDRDEIERLIAQGGKRFKGGWRREPKYA